jgi:hypothetical protein
VERLFASGEARGRLVELCGRRSCGRFSNVLTVLAALTGGGEAAALVDLGDGLDPRTAAEAGVELQRLLWVRPRHLKPALAAAEMLLATGFPLVVLELGAPPVAGGRGAEAAWLRLARAARDQGAALLVSSPYRVSGTAAAVILEAAPVRSAWHGRGRGALLAGTRTRIEVERSRGQAPGARQEMALRLSSPLPLPPGPTEKSRTESTARRPEHALAVAAG